MKLEIYVHVSGKSWKSFQGRKVGVKGQNHDQINEQIFVWHDNSYCGKISMKFVTSIRHASGKNRKGFQGLR